MTDKLDANVLIATFAAEDKFVSEDGFGFGIAIDIFKRERDGGITELYVRGYGQVGMGAASDCLGNKCRVDNTRARREWLSSWRLWNGRLGPSC